MNLKKALRRSVNTVGEPVLVNNGGLAVKDKIDLLEIRIRHLEDLVLQMAETIRRIENTIHYHRKIGDADGFGYWQVG